MKKPILETDHYYHIYNRGVEKRDIFLDPSYYQRFLNILWEFNDTSPAPDPRQPRDRNSVKRDKLVDVYAYVLMPNHFHLILRQNQEGGIERFMRKVGVGYAMYFNIRQRRVGALFQGRFKAVYIEDENQMLHLTRYIHQNPMKLVTKKEKGTDLRQMYNYRWSSFGHFIGQVPSDLIADDLTEIVTLEPDKYKSFCEEVTPPKENGGLWAGASIPRDRNSVKSVSSHRKQNSKRDNQIT